jgi:hypothetical protein
MIHDVVQKSIVPLIVRRPYACVDEDSPHDLRFIASDGQINVTPSHPPPYIQHALEPIHTLSVLQ